MDVSLIQGFLDGLRPEPLYTVSEWAEAHRYLSPVAAAEPGPWRTSRTPYLRAIMDDLSAYSPVQKVVFKKGAQIGATEAGNNWIGYIIDAAPAPTLMVQPTDETVRRNSKTRIDPMIEVTPRLREKIIPASKRDSGNTITSKTFPGGILVMAGANAPAGLRSMPARNLFLDEVDAYPSDLDGEGSPIDLAIARTRTFGRKKIYIVSTPTVQGNSVIDLEFDNTDQRYFYVPCPECGSLQYLKFERLKWEAGRPDTVRYHCEHCDHPIDHRLKTRMMAEGQWIATKKENERPDLSGYMLNALYSPFAGYTWENIASEYESALNDTPKMKTFVNTVLGESYREEGDAPPHENLYNRRELYPMDTVPSGVAFLTAGVDIQKDRIELEVVGWSYGKISHSICYRVLIGDTNKEDVWRQLAAVLEETWPREDGARLPLKMMAVDSGYNTNEVYAFCRKYDPSRVIPTKGQETLNVVVAVPRQVDVTRAGKKVGAVKVWNVGVSVIKSELYGWLRLEKAEDGTPPTGYCHFPQYDHRYFRGLVAEELQFRVVRGYRKYEWVKKYERNEPLDCRVYARAAASVVGMDRFTEDHWQIMSTSYGMSQPAGVQKKRKQSDFWG